MTTVPQVQITARDYLLSKGDPPISLNGAIALVAVLYRESRLSPASQGYQSTEHGGILNPHGAYGAASWNGPEDQSKVGNPLYDRQAALLAYATKYGLKVDVLETQLAFVLTEIANKYLNCWAAIRSSSSYQSIIPILVDEYEIPANKPAEISAALAFAVPLAALPAPQLAPAPVPQVPAPKVPAPSAPPPTAPAGLPPISASSAGRRAAEQAYIAAMITQLEAEVTALNEEISDFQGMAATLAKRNPAPTTQLSLSPVLPAPAAAPAASTTITQTQGMQNMLGTSWITSIFGTGSIASVIVTLGIDVYNKQMPDAATIATLGGLLSAGSGLLKAKDNNVTGGTVSAITGTVGKPVSLIDTQ